MIDFKALLAIVMAAVLVNNYVLAQFLGICPFLGVSKKLDQAAGMSVAVIFVMLLATAVTYPIQYFVLNPNGLGYLQTIVFILVIAALVQLVEIILKKYIPALHASLGVYLPLITTNCAVLGVCISNVDNYLTATGGFGGGFVQVQLPGLRPGLPAGHGAVFRGAQPGGQVQVPRVLQGHAHHPDLRRHRVRVLYGLRGHRGKPAGLRRNA